MAENNIVFTTEIERKELLHMDNVSSFRETECEKNPDHSHLIPFDSLTKEDFGIYSDPQLLAYIKYMGNRVVRVVVHHSPEEVDVASGFICKRDQQCYICTNKHVIGSCTEAQNCTIDLNFNSEDSFNKITVRGTELRFRDSDRDYCQVYFDTEAVAPFLESIVDLRDYIVKIRFPGQESEEGFYLLYLEGEYVIQTTYLGSSPELPSSDPIVVKFNDGFTSCITEIVHQFGEYTYLKFEPVPEWVRERNQAIFPVLNKNGDKPIITVSVSHPHGWFKMVSKGQHLQERQDSFELIHSSMTCGGSSGAPVFRIGIQDIGKFPRTMLYTHMEGCHAKEYQGIPIESQNVNRAVLNTRRDRPGHNKAVAESDKSCN